MIRVEVVKKGSVKVEPFNFDTFFSGSMASKTQKKVNKKALKRVADEAGLSYDESQIKFAKKLINAYLKSENGY